jgi:hypothetical protein
VSDEHDPLGEAMAALAGRLGPSEERAGKFELGETTYLDPDHFPDMVPICKETAEARARALPPLPPLIVTAVDQAAGVITLEEGPAEPPIKVERHVLNVASQIAAVSSRLMLAEIVAKGVIDMTTTMRAEGLSAFTVVSATRTDRGLEIVIEGKKP